MTQFDRDRLKLDFEEHYRDLLKAGFTLRLAGERMKPVGQELTAKQAAEIMVNSRTELVLAIEPQPE